MAIIEKPERSVSETSPEKLKPFLEGLAQKVGAGANWMVRKKIICDLLLGLDSFFALPAAERQAMLADDADRSGDETQIDDGPADFRNVLPLYVGAILERLGETTISVPEQAAVYLLSIHPEHQTAAERWMLADVRNAKAVRKLVRGDRRYRQLMDRMADHWRKSRAASTAIHSA